MAPSWVMLGFVVGAGFIWALPNRRTAVVEPEIRAVAPVPVRTVPQLTTIEAVFAEWGQYAVWDRDITQVALWSSETKSYSECYEVVRSSGGWLSSVDPAAHPARAHPRRALGLLPVAVCTETEAQRAEWLAEKIRKRGARSVPPRAKIWGPPRSRHPAQSPAKP